MSKPGRTSHPDYDAAAILGTMQSGPSQCIRPFVWQSRESHRFHTPGEKVPLRNQVRRSPACGIGCDSRGSHTNSSLFLRDFFSSALSICNCMNSRDPFSSLVLITLIGLLLFVAALLSLHAHFPKASLRTKTVVFAVTAFLFLLASGILLAPRA